MRDFIASSVIFALYSLEAQAAPRGIPGRSLEDCEAFAALFDNTCQDGAFIDDFANHAGAEVSCAGNMACPSNDSASSVSKEDYTAESPCTFTRKLCVSCSQASDDDDVYISVQTNNLPNHCTNSVLGWHNASDDEWSVKWNADMTGIENYTDDDFSSSEATDDILCDINRTVSSNLHESVDYQDLNARRRRLQPPGPPPDDGDGGPNDDDDSGDSGSTDYNSTASGIAFSGGYIFNALAGGNVDAVINEIETLSVCFDHPTPTNQFHYHYWSPCAKAGFGNHSTSDAPDLCPDTEACADWEGAADYAKTAALDGQDSYFQGSEWDYPIGLAKDGHILMGPYKNEDADSWECADRDVCNGTTLVNDAGENVYVYVGSSTFPYNLGCFGPGPAVNYAPTCTSNGCGSETETADDSTDDDGDFASSLVASATAAIFLSASLF